MYWRGVRGGSFELFGRVYSPVPATFIHERDVTCVVFDWGRRLMPPEVIRSASRSLDMIEVRFGRTEPSDSREMLLDLLVQTRGRIRRMARGSAITSNDHIAVSGPLATPGIPIPDRMLFACPIKLGSRSSQRYGSWEHFTADLGEPSARQKVAMHLHLNGSRADLKCVATELKRAVQPSPALNTRDEVTRGVAACAAVQIRRHVHGGDVSDASLHVRTPLPPLQG